MSRSEWDSSDGIKHVDFVVDVRSIQMLGSKKDNEQPLEQYKMPNKLVQSTAAENIDTEDIPF